MRSNVINEITVLTEDIITISLQLNLATYINVEESGCDLFKEDDVLKYLERDLNQWNDFRDFFSNDPQDFLSNLTTKLYDEINDVSLVNDGAAIEHIYLKKIEKFLTIALHFDEDVTGAHLAFLKNSCKSSQVRDFITQVQLIVDEINNLKSHVAELVQDSYLLAERSERFPNLIHSIGLLNASETGYETKENHSIPYPKTVSSHTKNQTEPGAKLQWTCKPAVAGYIISELIRAGYLAPPITNGEMSLKKLAEICSQLFEVEGHKPSVGSWRNVVDRDRNELVDAKRAKLKLPDLDQLS